MLRGFGRTRAAPYTHFPAPQLILIVRNFHARSRFFKSEIDFFPQKIVFLWFSAFFVVGEALGGSGRLREALLKRI